MFKYHPGLPIPNGKTCVWLFLSTEIMFFAGLIGTYIVLRFGAVAWPRPHDVHLSEPIGAFNTFVLICSSVTVVLALEAAKMAGGRMPLTVLLEAAIRHARDGYGVSARQARLTAEKLAELKDVPGFAATFLTDGKPPEAGTMRRQPALAATLGVDVDVVHRALADAETCARVFCALLGKLCANAATVGEAVDLLRPRRPSRPRAGATDGRRSLVGI